MVFLIFYVVLAVVFVHVCSLLETTLFCVRISTLLDRKSAGSVGAAHLLEIKQNRIDEAIGAILILNTFAGTVGSTLAGAQAARLLGEARVGLLSVALTLVLLVISEIVPKTMATRYAGSLSSLTGYVLWYLIWLTAPALALMGALIRLIARRPRERLTRREFAILVGRAPQQGAISLAESMLIGSLIYSRELTLKDVMSPESVIFMMDGEQTVGDLLAAPGADAFSRIPLYRNTRQNVVGYVSHREVLKAFALNNDRTCKLESFRRPIPAFSETLPVGRALEQVLHQREAISLVTARSGEVVGLVTVEDLLEAILGMEITDEAEAVAGLRLAVETSRKRRIEELRRRRMDGHVPPD
jgi:CBS domain containing-hemolysin-like protein